VSHVFAFGNLRWLTTLAPGCPAAVVAAGCGILSRILAAEVDLRDSVDSPAR